MSRTPEETPDPAAAPPPRTPVFALANQKGGVGKTTTAINLAACLTILHKRVLLIDMDPQANATSGLGLEKTPGTSLYPVLLGQAALAEMIRPTPYRRLDLVPSEVDLAGAEIDVARSDQYLHRFHHALHPLLGENHYDYILVDCPPSLGILTMNALTAADAVIIPMQCEYYALEGLSVMTDLIQRLRASRANPRLRLEGIIMTMYDRRTNLSRQVVLEIRNHFPDQAYNTLIPRSIRLSEAPSHGRAVVDYDPDSLGADAYKKLAREFVRRMEPAPA
jgi:chromosome partitioning protein